MHRLTLNIMNFVRDAKPRILIFMIKLGYSLYRAIECASRYDASLLCNNFSQGSPIIRYFNPGTVLGRRRWVPSVA